MNDKKKNADSVLPYEISGSPSLGGSSSSQKDDTTMQYSIQVELDGKWTKNRKLADKLTAVYRAIDEPRRAERVNSCGTWLEFAVHGNDYKLHSANFCKDRLCPMCQWRRSMKSAYQLSRVLDSAADNGCRFVFLTLTIRNCVSDDLPATVDVLLKGWESLRHNKRFKKAVLGSFRSLEVTYNRKANTFHPHLHIIFAVLPSYFTSRDYISQKEIRSIWAKCINVDYDPSCRIEKVRDSFGIDGDKDFRRSVLELTAPQSKVSESDRLNVINRFSRYNSKQGAVIQGSFEEQCLKASAFVSSLSYRRLFAYTGILAEVHKALSFDDAEDGDLVHTAENLRDDVADAIISFRWQFGSYIREEVI